MNKELTEVSGESQVMFKETSFQCYWKYFACIPPIRIFGEKNVPSLHIFKLSPPNFHHKFKISFFLVGDMK